MKKNNAQNSTLSLPTKKEKKSLQVEVDVDIYDASETIRLRLEAKITKRALVEHALKLLIRQEDPELAKKLGIY